MKWITTTLIVAIVLSTNSRPCVKGQDFEDRQVQEAQERRLRPNAPPPITPFPTEPNVVSIYFNML